jgi:hypothetical protein
MFLAPLKIYVKDFFNATCIEFIYGKMKKIFSNVAVAGIQGKHGPA